MTTTRATTAPIRTYQLLIAPSDAVVDTNAIYPEVRALDVGGADPRQVITVQATYKVDIEVPEGYTLLECLEVIPQDFSVGDIVYLDWFSTWQLTHLDGVRGLLEVSSVAGWDKELGNIGWSQPQPIKGTRKYLVTLSDSFDIHPNGGYWWGQHDTVQVVGVIN